MYNNTWKLMVLKLGELEVYKAQVTAFKGFDKKLIVPIISVAVFNDHSKIIVDTGIRDLSWVKSAFGENYELNCKCTLSEEDNIVNLLKKGLNLKPDNIDMVINTHLHYDHCGNNYIFNNAQFIVQRSEWEEAYAPFGLQEKYCYYKELFDNSSVNYFNWRFVNGEEEIAPGIIVFPTPGHTNGHQSVLVNTIDGVICITGDMSNTTENLWDNVPPGLTTDNIKAVKSFDEVRKRAEFIIPGHDNCIEQFQSSNFPPVYKTY